MLDRNSGFVSVPKEHPKKGKLEKVRVPKKYNDPLAVRCSSMCESWSFYWRCLWNRQKDPPTPRQNLRFRTSISPVFNTRTSAIDNSTLQEKPQCSTEQHLALLIRLFLFASSFFFYCCLLTKDFGHELLTRRVTDSGFCTSQLD